MLFAKNVCSFRSGRLYNAVARFSSTSLNDNSSSDSRNFYRVTSPSRSQLDNVSGKTIVGEIIDHALDLTRIRPGESIDIPYEVTISHSMRDFWQSAFYSHDRINTSTPFAQSLGLQDQVVPFHLMLFLAGSMSHADHAKLQVGFSKAYYHWPAYAGDTFKKRFVILSLRSTSDKQNSIINISCQLHNQHGVMVFSCEKTMMFPFEVPPSAVEVPPPAAARNSDFLQHLIQQVETLQSIGSQTLEPVRPGQLILHTLTRPLSETHSMQLATLARLTHERHFNTRIFARNELFIPGGIVLGHTCSLSSRDLHEVLYEELQECAFPNNLSPGDTVGGLSYISNLEEHVSGDIEALSVRTVGVKNCDVHRALAGKGLPAELFRAPLHQLRPAAIEELLKISSPELSRLVVCVADRKIYRQAPKQPPFLL